MKKKFFIGKVYYFFIFGFLSGVSESAAGMSVSGPITASSVTVTGDISVSSMTVSTITVSNLISVTGTQTGIKGLVLQSVFISTTIANTTNSTTLVAIPGLSKTVSLTNANNYFRISLSGLLAVSTNSAVAKASIERGTTDLGNGGFSVAAMNPSVTSTGIVITDSPGDMSAHTYSATFDVSVSTATATFTMSPVGYFLIEEVSR